MRVCKEKIQSILKEFKELSQCMGNIYPSTLHDGNFYFNCTQGNVQKMSTEDLYTQLFTYRAANIRSRCQFCANTSIRRESTKLQQKIRLKQ